MSSAAKNIKASAFQLAGRFVERSLGLVSTLILARLLVPNDFGLVAAVWLVIMFVEAIAETGALDYIVQKPSVDSEDVNTAWTLNLLLKLLVVAFIFLASTYVADYFNDSRLKLALPTLSIVVVLNALVNPYVLLLRRERKYEKLFKVGVFKKVLGTIATIAGALMLKNYWALIIGHFVSTVVNLILTYAYFNYRPKFSLVKIREQFTFSQWSLLRSVFGYCRSQLDTFLISQKFGTAALGGYHVSKYISMMPASELLAPALSPLMASFSEVQSDSEKLNYQITFSLLVIFFLTLPITSFIFFNADDLSGLLLGQQWVEYVPVFALLGVSAITMPLYNFSTSILYIKKKPKYVLYYDLLSFSSLALALVVLPLENMIAFAQVKVAMDIFFGFSYLYYSLNHAALSKILLIYVLIVFSAVVALFGAVLSAIIVSQTNVILSLIYKGGLYLVYWLAYTYIFYFLLLRKRTIGFHLNYLFRKYFKVTQK